MVENALHIVLHWCHDAILSFVTFQTVSEMKYLADYDMTRTLLTTHNAVCTWLSVCGRYLYCDDVSVTSMTQFPAVLLRTSALVQSVPTRSSSSGTNQSCPTASYGLMSRFVLRLFKPAFHHDTDTDSPDTPTSLRPTYARFPEVIPVASWTTRRRSRDDLREDVGEDVGVGVCIVECGL